MPALLDTVDPAHKDILNRKLSELSREKTSLESELKRLRGNAQPEIDPDKAFREILGGIQEL